MILDVQSPYLFPWWCCVFFNSCSLWCSTPRVDSVALNSVIIVNRFPHGVLPSDNCNGYAISLCDAAACRRSLHDSFALHGLRRLCSFTIHASHASHANEWLGWLGPFSRQMVCPGRGSSTRFCDYGTPWRPHSPSREPRHDRLGPRELCDPRQLCSCCSQDCIC